MIGLLLRGALRAPARSAPIAGALVALAAFGVLAHGDAAIAGLPGGVLLPLAAAAAHRAATADTRRAVDALVDRGLAPSRALCMHVGVSAALIFVTLGLGSAAFLALAHHPGDLSLARELLASVPVAFAASLAYASYYSFAGSFWRGHGVTFAILLDLVIGALPGLGWIVPQSHLGELLGAAPRSLSGPGHFAWLYALCIVYAALALRRTRFAAPALAQP